MTNTITEWASDSQHTQLAISLVKQGLRSKEEYQAYFKACNFIVNNHKYNGITVTSIARGILAVEYLVHEGKATCTRKNGLNLK